MRNIKLKHTDLSVSNIAFGTDSIGSLIDKKLSFSMLDLYFNEGGNLIDTAEGYADWLPDGKHASEKTIGEWLSARKNRSDIVISTKGGMYRAGEKHRLTEKNIFSDLEGSLKRLNTDYIDIYWLHRDAKEVLVSEVMDILAKAVRQGKVRYIGVSNWTNSRLDEANKYAEENNLPKLFGSQIQYSPAVPNVEKNEPDLVLMNDREYDYFKNHDLTVFAFASQAKGFFSKFEKGGKEALSPKAYTRYFNDETIKRFERLKRIKEKLGCTMGNIVIATICNNYDFTAIPIIGCKNEEQLKDSLKGGDISLTREELDFILKG